MTNINFIQRFLMFLLAGITMCFIQACNDDSNEDSLISNNELSNTKWSVQCKAYYYDLDGVPSLSPHYGGNKGNWSFYEDGAVEMTNYGNYDLTWKISGNKLIINFYYDGEPDGTEVYLITENEKDQEKGSWTITLRQDSEKEKESYYDPDYRLYILSYKGIAE